MAFSLPSIEEVIKGGQFNFDTVLLQKDTSDQKMKNVNMDDSLETLIHSFCKSDSVLILDKRDQPVGFVTAPEIVQILYTLYRQLEAFYSTVVQTTDSSVTVIDKEERVQTWTQGAEKIFSIKRNEILGRKITDFFDSDKLEILESLHHGRSITHHQHQPRSDLFVLINSTPVYCDGQIIGAVVSETDMTSQVLLNEKLFNMSTEVQRLEQEVAKYRKMRDPFAAIKGKSTALQHTVEMAKKVCTVKSTVLILGESGVGKEIFAKAIHEASEEENAPFISVNCGAIPESLFESEMFGYEKGAFSGAIHKGKKGKIELAKGGTLFLDEIGEMPLDMQVKLLRVLQEQKFFRIGGEKEIEIDFRIIAATNKDLAELVKVGQFREDLFYRLNVVSIYIPPLRDRKEDIIELTTHFLKDFSIRYERPIQHIPPEVIHALLQYDWPGNIRELQNVIERLVVFSTDGIIQKEYLPFVPKGQQTISLAEQNEKEWILPLQEEMDTYEKKVLERALRIVKGNKALCAKHLGITRATLYNRMKRVGLS